jgi:hypothetical protein
LLAAWALGPYVPGLSLVLIPSALLGMTVSTYAAGRYLVQRAVRNGVIEAPGAIRWQTIRPTRRRLELLTTPAPAGLPLHIHVLAGLLFASMILVAVGIVTALPLGFIWLASQVSPTTAPGTWPYLLIAVGTAVGAALGLRLLAALHSWHCSLTGRQTDARRATPWLRSLSDTDWIREPGALVEWVVVVTVVVTVLLLAIWLLAFADPSKLVPQELQPA